MHLLFVNRVYPPAEGATGFLLQELAEAFASQGDEVTVVASSPGSAGATMPEGNNRIVDEPGVKLLQVKGLPFTRSNHLKRSLAYLSLYPRLLIEGLRAKKVDILFTMTDPPLQLVLGPILKMAKGGRLIHWAQDIYPELAEELGVLSRNGMLARFLRRVSTAALKRHDLVIVVGRYMKEKLIQRGVDSQKIFVIPNWPQEPPNLMDEDTLQQKTAGFRKTHGLEGKFVVMYSGNFGLAHDFSLLLVAIPILERELPEMQFLFVGGGPQYDLLKERIQNCRNVKFLPYQPKDMLPISLRAADLHIATMKMELDGLVVPSKVYGVLGAGKPCLFLGPTRGEAAKLIEENDCGAVIPPGATDPLLIALRRYYADRELVQRQGKNAIQAVQKASFSVAFSKFKAAVSPAEGPNSLILFPAG